MQVEHSDVPPISEQQRFWDTWIDESTAWENNSDNMRRAACVLAEAERMAGGRKDLRILDVGCGTGWVAQKLSQFGTVTGTDLGKYAITKLQHTHPHIKWIDGDFVSLPLDRTFNFVCCMETIAHVPDQVAFVRRMADVMVPGGTMVLTSQNAYVWQRRSWLQPPGEGQIRNWPTRRRLRELFEPRFRISRLTTCAPGNASRGLPHWVNSKPATALGSMVLGRDAWTAARERAGFGCSLLLVATRI